MEGYLRKRALAYLAPRAECRVADERSRALSGPEG